MLPKISIIILNYNGALCLNACVDSVIKSSYPNIEIIIFDNNSPDHSIELINQPKYRKCIIIKSKYNIGFSEGNNQAVGKATGKYLYFINNDTKLYPNTIELLFKHYQKHQPGIATTSIMSYDGKILCHSGIAVDVFGFPLSSKGFFYAEGSSLFISKKLFLYAGKFDPLYFMFHEDVDLSWRIRLLGYNIDSVTESKILHIAGHSAGGGPPTTGNYKSSILRRYYSERNNFRTIIKNYKLRTLLLILPLYFLINLSEIFLFMIMLKPRLIYLYFKAYLWNIYHLSDTLKRRYEIQSKRKISDSTIIKNMYFGSGKIYMFKKVGLPEFT